MSDMPPQDIMARVRQLVPPMLSRFHKGQLGRIGVIGGSEDYTGAPYFSAMASARLGCDMSHVICTPAAAAVIKTYSPNLMVHPLMRSLDGDSQKTDVEAAARDVSRAVIALLPRLHVLVVGPGLGRDALMQATVAHVIAAARAADMPLVLDADALLVVQAQPELVRGYAQAVLTPNHVEFKRLEAALIKGQDNSLLQGDRTLRLSRALGGVTIVEKGDVDMIVRAAPSPNDKQDFLVCSHQGSRKRSGGQGDTLTGAIATFLGWRKAYHEGLWAETAGNDYDKYRNKNKNKNAGPAAEGEALDKKETLMLAAYGGSVVTRECARLAFAKRGRSLQASDLTEEVHAAFENLFGEDEKTTFRI